MTLYKVKFVRAIDGDTIVVNVPDVPVIFGHLISIRLAGIQCEEIRSKDKNDFHLAMKAKQFSQGWCSKAETLTLFNVKRGKYFRLVADVGNGNSLLNGELVARGLAVKKQF